MQRVDSCRVLELLAAEARTASADGAAVDVRALYARGLAVLQTANASAGDTMDVRLQDSPDGSTGWADVPGGAFAQITPANGGTYKLSVDLDSVDAFVRARVVIAGTSPSIVCALSLVGPVKDGPDTVG